MSLSSLNFVFLLVVAIWSTLCRVEATCEWGEYDFSLLDGFPWNVKEAKATYTISLCKALSSSMQPAECKDDVSVCFTNGTETHSLGSYVSDLPMQENVNNHEITLILNGSACARGLSGDVYKTIIIFKCGKTLGSPVFLDYNDCDTYFEWHTTAACKKSASDLPVNEMKCSLYDGDSKRDLSSLVKQKGGYLVNSADEAMFYINVCRDITPDGATSTCPPGSGACLLSGDKQLSMGHPPTHGQLLVNGGQLELTYISDQPMDGCDTNPTTKIIFKCPSRGGGRDPLLITSMNCQYVVEWETEYACPEETLVTHDCMLNQDQHGIDFDLTPLAKPKGDSHPYKVTVPDTSARNYTYYINVCQELGISCNAEEPMDKVAVCQLHDPDDGIGKILGKTDHMQLRYADGNLTLAYNGGHTCHTNFQRTTVINFICNQDAPDSGRGWPVFSREDACTYIFDWETKYACLSHPLDSRCSVTQGSKRFDLSSLVRGETDAGNWEALQPSGDELKSSFYINVCHDLLPSGDASNCPEGAAACLKSIDSNNQASYTSLGKYINNPTYEDRLKSVILHYTEGSTCDSGKNVETFITLRCKPGDRDSPPALVHRSNDGCVYEFEWDTASACVLQRTLGSDCRVYDEDLGFTFDLSNLTSTTFYKISDEDDDGHDYYINVCDTVTGSPCNTANIEDAGVCQVPKKDSSHTYNAGKAVSSLEYYDGMISLKYVDGTPYHSTPPAPRMSQIVFLCDPKAGAGQPRFLVEGNHTYSFEWSTAYACPAAPTECVVIDHVNNKQYDLSSLSKSAEEENWVTVHTDGSGRRRKFYMNVCRPVNSGTGVTSECDDFAAVCVTEFAEDQEHLSIPNLGQAKSGPKVGDSELVLEYTSGFPCPDDKKKFITTKIHFHCKEGDLASGPVLMDDITDECEFSFLWETAAACPIGEAHAGALPCSLTDPVLNYTFNLHSLTKKDGEDPYKVEMDGKNVLMNICGNVTGCSDVAGGSPAVCEGQTGLAKFTDKLELSGDGHIRLTYLGARTDGAIATHVEINFLCKEGADRGQPVFVRKDETSYEFEFETPLVCPPKPVDCLVTDSEGHEYDLSGLGLHSGNWRVVDTRIDHGDLTYFINVCRPLNPLDGGLTCAGGPVGACQVNSNGETYNLGYIQGRPQAGSGSLTLTYFHGDMCHGTFQRSTQINFFCSATQQDPEFVKETEDCQYIINWNTPHACPWKRATGEDCKVKDTLYDVTYDLNTLMGRSNYEVTAGEYKYLLNVCAPLSDAPGECGDGKTGACQTKTEDASFVVNAGEFNKKLTFEAGILTLTYSDGKAQCHQKFNRTTVLKFVCDAHKHGTEGPHFVNETSECSYVFEWPTSLACNNAVVTKCMTTDDQGRQYNLDNLMRSNGNYEYSHNTAERKFVLNVCSTVNQETDVTCPAYSAACLIDVNEKNVTKRFKSIGEVRGDETEVLEVTDEGRLMLTYQSREKCPDQIRQKTTVVMFECDHDILEGGPELLKEDTDCVYTFMWKTLSACPSGTMPPIAPGNNCTVRDAQTNYEYDLSPLKHQEGYSVQNTESKYTYHINVCAPLRNSPCGTNSGSCQEEEGPPKRHWNAGEANSMLMYSPGVLSLNYSSGEVCHHNNRPRITMLYFVCVAKGFGLGSPVISHEDSEECSYHVTWHTELACDREVACTVEYQGQVLNLSPLIKSTGHYLVAPSSGTDTADTSYYINICRPLNPISGKHCPPEAAACKIREGESPVSLGHLKDGPSVDPTSGKVTLVYENGVPCTQDPSKNTTSKIVFTCEPGLSQGEPQLQEVVDCEYMFTWATNAVCLPSGPVTDDKCTFTDTRTKYTYDFSQLLQSGTEGYKVPHGTGNFFINVCSSVVDEPATKAGCGNTPVCYIDEAGKASKFGSAISKVSMMELTDVKFVYQGGSPCPYDESHSQQAIFLFTCDPLVSGLGQPKYMSYGKSCDAIFKWPTHLACLPVIEKCSYEAAGVHYDLSEVSKDVGSWTLAGPDGTKYWINLCKSVHGGPDAASCPDDSAVCRQTSDGTVDMLGTVQTQHIYSEGEGFVVEFTEGATVCLQSRRRSDPKKSSTKIKFTCGDAIGEPVFVSSDNEDCVFSFEWKSNLACKKGSTPADGSNGAANTDVAPSSGSHRSTAAVVVSLFAAVILAGILLIVFHKAERRSAFMSRVRRLFGHTGAFRRMEYSSLSAMDESEDTLLGGDTIGRDEYGGAEERPSLPSFHDDSDDDMLL